MNRLGNVRMFSNLEGINSENHTFHVWVWEDKLVSLSVLDFSESSIERTYLLKHLNEERLNLYINLERLDQCKPWVQK